ncbi:pyridoxamine 5'-phosphate oxidase family protein [Motiliproteus coralliicola]|uniref:Pyridoxamine 5'-phosphate oxidase family protein n=1 Tax=Motiliproteus coralliicola TaxID=2283196 RepID=A0A369WKZ6_9GAMM|nr:pyridoxamine 5'-phosphate oxidase family protein [Motiliproteus coralliicola]RDE22748.1 pyridoxamine 5'-phosphate oxidase family protein [Motiliproteus coralliicola]
MQNHPQPATVESNQLSPTERSRIRRCADRASYRRDDIYRLIDDLKTGHIGFVSDGLPVVIPMTVWRVDDHLYFHSLNKSRLHKLCEAGAQLCISFAECSEWVLAKSAYHHSANYRSAVLYGQAERVTDPVEFDRAFEVIINQIEAGRWDQVRAPNAKERKITALLRMPIDEGSFKRRQAGPSEEPEDMELPVWHGTVPVCPFHSNDKP